MTARQHAAFIRALWQSAAAMLCGAACLLSAADPSMTLLLFIYGPAAVAFLAAGGANVVRAFK